MIRQKRKKVIDSGFSLVELIVVVLIMAILAVALTPQVMKWVNNAKKARDLDYMHTLEKGVKLAMMDSSVNKEVRDAVTEDRPVVVLIVDGSKTDDPLEDGAHPGVHSKLFLKTAEVLGIDTSIFENNTVRTSLGEIRISITGGYVTGTYTVNGSVVDLSEEY